MPYCCSCPECEGKDFQPCAHCGGPGYVRPGDTRPTCDDCDGAMRDDADDARRDG